MSFKFNCPECGQKLEAESEWIGCKTQCPSCNHDIIIQAPLDNDEETECDVNKEIENKKSKIYENNTNPNQDDGIHINDKKIHVAEIIVSVFLLSLIFIWAVGSFFSLKEAVSDSTVKEVENKKSDRSITINCFLYNSYNEKKTPYFIVEIFDYHKDIESRFMELLKLYRDNPKYFSKTNQEQIEYIINRDNSTESLLALHEKVKKILPIQMNLNLLKMGRNLNKPIIKSESRSGTIKLICPSSKQYTLVVLAEWGAETIFWIRHINQNNNNLMINLTNDNTCFITDIKE